MKRTILASAAIAAALALPSTANATPWLSKGRAHAKVNAFAQHAYNRLSWATDYWTEPVSSCERLARDVVECVYGIDDDQGGGCTDIGRVRATPYGLLLTFPSDPYCTD